MKMQREWQTAMAAVSAAAGVSIASGRQMAVFFAQMQRASWIGVLAASVLFGAMCGMISRIALQNGAKNLAGVCQSIPYGRCVAVIYGMIMLFTGAVMLSEAGRLAELALPVHNAYWMGVLLSMGLASMLCIRGMCGWGNAAVLMCAVFYAVMALDPRPVRFYMIYDTELKLSGSVPAALAMGVLHAGLSGSAAAGIAASGRIRSPLKLAAGASGVMFLLLTAANAALLRGGERLLSQALPTVMLAARWGKIGFYGCIGMKWMCTVATLCSALNALIGRNAGSTKGDKKRVKLCELPRKMVDEWDEIG